VGSSSVVKRQETKKSLAVYHGSQTNIPELFSVSRKMVTRWNNLVQ
jgi:hypothetical protein